jgi:hypothetical protein
MGHLLMAIQAGIILDPNKWGFVTGRTIVANHAMRLVQRT